jgi:hypothetical protein
MAGPRDDRLRCSGRRGRTHLEHDVGPTRHDEWFVHQEVLAGGQRVRWASNAPSCVWLRQDGPARGLGQRFDAIGVVRGQRVSAARQDQATLGRPGRFRDGGDGLHGAGVDRFRPARARRHFGVVGSKVHGRAGRHQRLAEGQVEVDRPGRWPVRLPPCAAGKAAPPHGGVRSGLRDVSVHRPSRVGAEHADLVDRLVRADAAQLGRPVGGQQQQRRAGHRRFDDGREQVRDRGP